MNLRKTIISFILFLGLVGIGILIKNKMASMKKPPISKNRNTDQKRIVLIDEVKYGNHHVNIHSQGRVQSIQTVDITSEVQGKIVQIGMPLKEGTFFKKGQLIAEIDDVAAKLRIQSSKSDFIKTVSSILADIKIDYPQSFSQWENYFMQLSTDKPLQKLPTPKSTQEKTFIANKGIDKLFYSIQSDENLLTKYKIYAPFNGTIKDVFVQQGSLVNANTKIIQIINTDNFEIQLAISEAYTNQIAIGQIITLSTEDKKKTWKAKIVRKGSFIETSTQSINVYAEILEKKQELIEGMYLVANIQSTSIPNVMEITRKAVYGNEVYTVLSDSTLKLIPIEIVQKKENTILFKGLSEKQVIVIEPVTNLIPNEKVSTRKQ